MKSARNMALEVIHEVDQQGAYSNIALNRVLQKYNPDKQDRGFITELVYGTLRRIITIDWIAGQFVSRPLDSLTPWIRNILRMGIYQLFFMDKVPVSAACNESTKLAKKFGHPGTVKFVNGVMRNIAREKDGIRWPNKEKDPINYLALNYSHPQWMVQKWQEELGLQQAEELCRANNMPPPNSVRTNTLKNFRDELIKTLKAENITCVEGAYAPETINITDFLSIGTIDAHRKGLFIVQDESSTMVGHALSPKPGAKVIDACSAPGGKATHLAQLMGNRGEILACDVHEHKMILIEDNCRRLGINIVKPMLLNALELGEKYPEWADYILVDAPCSGLGVLRRRPELRWRKTFVQFEELISLQRRILSNAANALKKGGVLVYSTCTINRDENLNLVEGFLKEKGNFVLQDLTPYMPQGMDLTKFATMKQGYIQFLPHLHGTDGFFMARLYKKG